VKVLVSGSTGLIGSALVPELLAHGHRVTRLVRAPQANAGDAILWNPEAGQIDRALLEGVGAVVHLAGESLTGWPWTESKKARIRQSRVLGTRLLCESLATLKRSPRIALCASAVGYYGNRGSDVLTEESGPGTGFLATVCREWEDAAAAARAAGIRVVHARFGIVLSRRGGALAQMLPIFRSGTAGPIGSGRQYISWIAIDDAIGAIMHALATAALSGPMNVAAPTPVTNAEFVRILASVLRRPAALRVPAFAIRLLLGEMADEMLLASARLLPRRLVDAGYVFQHPELEGALRHLLA
jgi:hypothetical protein